MNLLDLLTGSDLSAWHDLVDRVGPMTIASWLSPQALVAATLADTAFAAAVLEGLRGESAPAVAAAFPETLALAAPMAAQVEHDAGSDRPLLDHIATRILGRKLLGLERGDLARFQDRGLSPDAFAALSTLARRVIDARLGPALRVALIHLDIAKTASVVLRTAWAAQGISLDVHNEASAAILRRSDRARSWPLPEILGKLAIALVEAHGLAGQHVRGESPLAMFAPLVGTLRDLAPGLGRVLGVSAAEAVALALDALHVINACDTAAVREGLLDDALLDALLRVRDVLATVCRAPAWHDVPAALRALAPRADRASLGTRLRSLRGGRDGAAIDDALAAIGDTELAVLAPALATCQLWYCESATGGLSPAAQLGVLAAAVGAARKLGVEVSRPWHAQLRPLVARLHGETAAVRYRLRLVEAAISRVPIRDLITGAANLGPLGALSSRLAHPTDPDAIVVDYTDTDESAALVTLLGLYETRDRAAFHTMLKALCDLYGLRKDDFDRVANEASYLSSMNGARSDKARMLDLVKPGRIVEIGPGGGVVLDLLEARFPGSEILGVDLSREVVTALSRHRRGWKVVLGAAEELAQLVPTPVDTVVFCSILHEVFSYGEPAFAMARVERVVRAAYSVLAPGGRIVIRDGVMPPAATRRLRFIAPDARTTFELYVAQFEGRRIAFTELAADRVELSAADAMEFLYTYTWGPASFPYEVRELYGLMTYDAYVAQLLAWCGPDARVVEIAESLRSYLQPGYRDHLAPRIELTDERDQPVALPDSNCLIAITRP